MKIAITAIGKDRTGIVRDLTQALLKHHCNLEDTSMTIVSGEFAMILIVKLSKASSVKALENDLKALERKTHFHISLSKVELSQTRTQAVPNAILSLVGADKPGIVHHVAKFLATCGVNITDLNSKIVMSGGKQVYIMILEMAVGKKMSVEKLEPQLKALEKKLAVQIHLERIASAEM
jgi:glycine cleavage system transcriptional repressor